jgi:hypothetical protein
MIHRSPHAARALSAWTASLLAFPARALLLLAVWVISPIHEFGFGQEFLTSEAKTIAGHIDDNALHGHLKFLADDLLEGRGPGSKGDAIAQLYLESQFRSMGLQPLPSLNGYKQSFPILGLTSDADKVWNFDQSKSSSGKLALKHFEDFIAVAGTPSPKISIEKAELVFVGYGIEAPE